MNIKANFDVFVCFCSKYELKSNSEIPVVQISLIQLD